MAEGKDNKKRNAPKNKRGAARSKDSRAKGTRTKDARAKRRRVPLWLLIIVGTVVVLAIALWSYYPVAKQQYLTTRENQRLEAELAYVKNHNKQLENEIAKLQTPEGIEDYARKELGWVKNGENSVIVDGIVDGSKESLGVDPLVDAGSIEITSTPVTRFLDMVFGIDTASPKK